MSFMILSYDVRKYALQKVARNCAGTGQNRRERDEGLGAVQTLGRVECNVSICPLISFAFRNLQCVIRTFLILMMAFF